MVNPRLAETGVLKSESETKCSDLIEKQICDRQKQNLRLQDPLGGCARFRDLGRICRDFSFFRGPFTTPIIHAHDHGRGDGHGHGHDHGQRHGHRLR